MRGQVVCYRPHEHSGVIASDDGGEFVFRLAVDAGLQGGDLVEFAAGSAAEASDVHLVKAWVEQLNEQYRPLVNAFHATVEIDQTAELAGDRGDAK